MDLQLTGKRAIVTGGSRGIGKAVAWALAREGVHVVLAARGEEALRAAATEIAEDTGRTIVPVPTDTTDDAGVKHLVAEAVRTLGGVDILVNCAAQVGGVGPIPRLPDITNENFFPDMDVKVLGYIRTCREVAPHMIAQHWGRIINISGLAARNAGGSMVGSIRNASVTALTKNIADELGPHGINVTVVHPGTTRTEVTSAAWAARAAAEGKTVEDVERALADGNSIKHLLSADDIANVVTFLASPLSIAINGDTIAAGGGTPRAIYY